MVDFRSIIPNHENPAPLCQVLIDHKLLYTVFISVSISSRLRTLAGLYTPHDFLIAGICGFCIKKLVIFVIEIDSCFRINKHIFNIWQTMDFQFQKGIHKSVGIHAGTYISNTLLTVKNRVIHRKNHCSGTG